MLNGGVSMGRSTPSLRVVVNEYIERLEKLIETLPDGEKSFFKQYLDDIETTLSICMHTGVVDPVEVLLIHLLRRLSEYFEK